MIRFRIALPSVDVDFDTGTFFVRVMVTNTDAANYVLAFDSPWLASGAIAVESYEHCKVQSTKHRMADLGFAVNFAAGDQSVEVGDPPQDRGNVFLGVNRNEAQFRLRIDTSHGDFRKHPAGSRIGIEFKSIVAKLGDDPANVAHGWVGTDAALVLITTIRGPLAGFGGAFAIDVGTTNTCAAFMRVGATRPTLFQLDGQDSVPTLVGYRRATGNPREYKIGEEAKFIPAGGDSRFLARGIKRYLGVDELGRKIEIVDAAGFPVDLQINDVYQDFLVEYLRSFERTERSRLRTVKATCPPGFSARARRAVEAVFKRLGIQGDDRQKLIDIDEASAAALYYVWLRLEQCGFDLDLYRSRYHSRDDDHNMLVIDCGGGTTDVALVRTRLNSSIANGERTHQLQFIVLGATSAMNIAGDNFTLAVFKAIRARIALAVADAHPTDDTLKNFSPSAKQALAELRKRRKDYAADLEAAARGQADDRMIALLDAHARDIIPTAWNSLNGPGGRYDIDPKAVERAQSTFLTLWDLAELKKRELCDASAERKVKLALRIGHGAGNQFLEDLRIPIETWEGIELNREADLHLRIRELVEKAVQTSRQVTRAPDGTMRRIDSVQLVGNSSRLGLVREAVLREFAPHVPGIADMIEHNPSNSKAAVAMGACLYSFVHDLKQRVPVALHIEDMEAQLGYEIGEYSHFGREFKTHFRAETPIGAVPAERDIADTGINELLLYKRAPGLDPHESQPPEVLGMFNFVEEVPINALIPRVPDGIIRLTLINRYTLQAVRGQKLYKLKLKKHVVDERDDPFSGVH
jgi:molecular chaperone DnaK (HSP70)